MRRRDGFDTIRRCVYPLAFPPAVLEADRSVSMTLDNEVTSLRQVPLFREVEPSRLKLLAFTSERVHFEA